MPASLLDAAPNLKLVCESGTGMNNIDVKACEERGIKVRNVVGYSTDSVAQTTFMHILSLMGNAPYFDAAVKSGAYSRSKVLTDVCCHRETDIGIDIDLAYGQFRSLSELFLRNTNRIRHIAAVLIDHSYKFLWY